MNLGKIRFEWSGIPCVATLDCDLQWSCEPPKPGGTDLAGALGTLCDPAAKSGPEWGQPGFATLHDAATWLDGNVFDLRPIPESDPHAVY